MVWKPLQVKLKTLAAQLECVQSQNLYEAGLYIISSHIQLIYCLRSLRFCGHVLCRILLQILDLFVIFVLLNNLRRTTIYTQVIDTTGTFR